MNLKEARFYQKLDKRFVKCLLCPHFCVIKDGNLGRCKIRKNIGGVLYALSYNKITALNVDPIEKKPLYHFYPGSKVLSLGFVGCNFSCRFCQNYNISQRDVDSVAVENMAVKDFLYFLSDNPERSVAYTYNEPLINFEYVKECARLVHKRGINNILVTNGFINKEPLKELVPYIDAANIDIKGFNPGFYKDICGGELKNVKESIELMYSQGVFIELTYLLIPKRNYDTKEFIDLVKWIRDIDKKIPFHISRYFPAYKMDDTKTPVSLLEDCYRIARKYLDYVYVGNIDILNDTFCPKCDNLLINRYLYTTQIKGMDGNKCDKCGEIIGGKYD